ncbi:hypothetical protein JHK85_048785 [Glycine max]|nr:hypothetical protein JHK86_048157 [Glycine max]KAG4944139.1 hypothetical protein JHK85_048785 [Glycine max]
MKRRSHIQREKGKLNDLLSTILLLIMSFMNIQHVAQTCIMSKWWKDRPELERSKEGA